MRITPWPIVPRQQVMRAFSPGVTPASEAAYRTLKGKGWTSPGVNFTVRAHGRLAGTLTLFSALNIESAWLARLGDRVAAKRCAKAAKALESSRWFGELEAQLGGCSIASVHAVVRGEVSKDAAPELWRCLRELARETEELWPKSAGAKHLDVVTGRVAEVHESYVVLDAAERASIAVPRWMAKAVGRDVRGCALAVVTEKVADSGVMMETLPALDLEERAPVAFSPFGRGVPPPVLPDKYEKTLRGGRTSLKVLVPVTIES